MWIIKVKILLIIESYKVPFLTDPSCQVRGVLRSRYEAGLAEDYSEY